MAAENAQRPPLAAPIVEQDDRPSRVMARWMDDVRRRLEDLEKRVAALETP